jgi:hypothetical protein
MGRGYTTVLIMTVVIKKRSEKRATFKTCLTRAPSSKRALVRDFFKRPTCRIFLEEMTINTFPESCPFEDCP